MERTSISVITTTKGGPIDRLAASLYPFYGQIHEFIIVDANSHKRASAKLYKYPKVKILNGKGTNRSGGKNVGIKCATGNVLVFLDDDVRVTEGWIRALKKAIQSADIVAGWSPPPYGKEHPRVPVYVDGQDITYPTCNIAYRKEVFDKVGLFDEALWGAEDIDFNKRCVDVGYTIAYDPRVKVYHRNRTGWGFAEQYYRYGYSRRLFNKKYPELKRAHHHGLSLTNCVKFGFGGLGYCLGGIFYSDK